MGLLRILGNAVAWPVTGPAFLTRYSMGQVKDAAVRELTDESAVRDELLELQLGLERGEIGEETYVEEEARLMRHMREIRDWRQRLGMPVRGGPVGSEGRVRLDIDTHLD